MKVYTKDGSEILLEEGATCFDLAYAISSGLGRNALAAEVNGENVDLRRKLKENDQVNILTFDDDYGKHAFHHSTSHLLAQAVLSLYPDAKLAIGPAIKDGFYYDIDFGDEVLTDEDLGKIEKEMKKFVSAKLPIERFEKSREEALVYFKEKGEIYKVELIEDLPEDATISFYKQGDFVDLCAGPHVMNTSVLKAFKLTSLAGAYWRGSEKNKMLTRIYGISFPKKKLLDEYLLMLEEAKKRDHRKIGKEMKLFMFSDKGPGFPFFLKNGMIIKNELIEYWRELHRKAGYEEISTPIMLNKELWETSGHWYHYRENMYTSKIDGEDFAIKPMNCPGSLMVYNSEPRSYRDLPLRLGELGLVHRHELSGALHGLFRVRCFTQDDAHIFMTQDMITDEIIRVVSLIDEVYTKFGFKYHIELSTRPEDSMGTEEEWEKATDGLRNALEKLGKDYVINEGDGAFYGPKIDFQLEDAIGRTWQCGTIQLDFQLPQRFEAEYIGKDGEKHRPIMIHRVVYGAIERFLGILIEQYAGDFPIWLAPCQVKLIPVNNEIHGDFCKNLADELLELGVRCELDLREETLGKKIREAQIEKSSLQIVIGDKEVEEKIVTIRKHGEEETTVLPWEEFLLWIKKQIDERI